MEQSPAKRRKLSPSTARPASANRPTNSQNVASSRPRRASFMSPTKASLAKFNPKILGEMRSEPSRRGGRTSTRLNETPTPRIASKIGTGNENTMPMSEPPRAEASFPIDDTQALPGSSASGISSAPRRRSRTPQSARISNSKSIDDSRDHVTKSPNQRPIEGEPSHVEVANMDEENHDEETSVGGSSRLDQATQKRLPYTPTRRGAPGASSQDDDQEPSLPSTPSQLGLEPAPERPKGLFFGTPSKRAKTKSGPRKKGPSPLKSQETEVEIPHQRQNPKSGLGSKIYIEGLPRPPLPANEQERENKISEICDVERQLLKFESSNLKAGLLSRWVKNGLKRRKRLATRKKGTSELLARLVVLREELEDTGDANDDLAAGANSEQYFGSSTGNSNEQQRASLDLATRLSQFFPFSGLSPIKRPKPDAGDAENLNDPETQNLPFSTTILASKVLPSSPDGTIPQEHDIQITPLSEPANKVALRLIFDSKTHTVLQVRASSPESLSANEELHRFLRHTAPGKGLDYVGTAVGRYLEVTRLRAQCWRACSESYPNLADLPHDATSSSSQPDPSSSSTAAAATAVAESLTFHRRPNTSASLTLTIVWQITFNDTTGEIESRVRACVDYPPAWTNEQSAGDESVLGKAGEAFDALVRERGVTGAVKVLVMALFPFL